MLTAAVRDLHACYPGQFVTDVRTRCPDLWQNNPHLTPLDESAPGVEILDCEYPLINQCDDTPCHCLHGYLEFLNDRLGRRIRLTRYQGDIHLSAQEKAWHSQVHELTREDTPFWILTAGGKYDVTVKWWSAERYQRVVDHFKGKIVFAQVGQQGHHHPKLNGVIDLRGRTTLRELIRLVHHADGVLCPITCAMHLAAAVEWKRNPKGLRPCVVVAGGREPVHWEQYPGHQFLHTIGALKCCARTGCWRDRIAPLGDGDERDDPKHLCLDVVNDLPRCLDMISAEEVIHRIESYYQGGMLAYLARAQSQAARKGIRATRNNPFDRLPLTSGNVRLACAQFIRTIPECPSHFRGRGIVIGAGGCRLFTCAWVCVNLLRQHGCTLPIQVWHLGEREMDARMAALLAPLGVECVDASKLRQTIPCRILGGWELKSYSVLHSPYEEVLYLDADNVPVANPEYLFDEPEYRKLGAIFWPDLGQFEKTKQMWDLLGLARPVHAEFESGQMVVNKRACWRALALALWMNEHSDFFYRIIHGDKETFHLAFRKLNQPFVLVPTAVKKLFGTMCQHDLQGRRLFQHRNSDKWNLFANNPPVEDFWFEEDCRRYLRQLQELWSGRVESKGCAKPARLPCIHVKAPVIQAGMISCTARDEVRRQTLRNLERTDWGQAEVLVEMDDGVGDDPKERQQRSALRLLKRFLQAKGDHLLFLEDDLDFNRWLRHNLEQWPPLQARSVTLAGLYNPGLREEACDVKSRAYVIRADHIFGSQAFLLSRKAAQFMIEHWNEVEGMQDIRMSRLAGRLGRPIYYHSPSLVQHVGAKSTWGGVFHEASDFDAHVKC